MNNKKVALIAKEEISAWRSCQSITSNLEKAYRDVFKNDSITLIKVAQNFNHYNAYILAADLKKQKVDTIVWIDHKPNAALLLEALDQVYKEVEFSLKPKFVVHLFGDFVLDCNGWQSAMTAMKAWPIHFVTASDKQKSLVESFFIASSPIVSSIAFPVDEREFYFDESLKLREQFRKDLNLSANDFVLLYTGRISYQKNIEILVKTFSSLIPVFGSHIKLLIAGDWDDILMPYSGKFGPLGSYFAQFSGTSEKYLSSQIQFIGKLNQEQLLSAYNGSDLFVSFSTYNDEDYGMSPAEALCSGLPSLLSNWGGYTHFAKYCPSTALVPISFGAHRPQVQLELARKMMMKSLSQGNLKPIERKELASLAWSQLSIASVSLKLCRLLEEAAFLSLSDVSQDFLKLCALNEMNPGSPFKKGKKQELAEFYRVVYGRYGA